MAKNHSLVKRIDNEESAMRSQKLLPELDKELYCVIDERNNSVELTEKGIKYLSESGQVIFLSLI
jgi:preprotein translocase subunit SecA